MKPASEVEHAPTPWRAIELGVSTIIVAGNTSIARLRNRFRNRNAKFIVKAVNNHDALVAALESMTCHGCNNRIGWDDPYRPNCESCKRPRAALAAVEGAK